MKLLIIKMLFMASFISCKKESTVVPETLFIKLMPERGFVKVNDSISVGLYVENSDVFQLEYEWSADKGIIKGMENKAMFYAPDSKDDVSIVLKLTDQYGKIYKDSIVIKVYKQFVILKADDLVNDSYSVFPARWNKFIEFIEKKDIKASIGIIGNSLASNDQAYFNRIKDYHRQGRIEFWNHGYAHLLNGINSNGEKYHEYFNSTLEYQKTQIEKTQSLAKNKLGFYFKSFGAPGNAIDDNTLIAIEADSTIKVWFYGNTATSKLNLRRHPSCEIEYPTHHPDYQKFNINYNPTDDLLVLQVHPNSWSEARFEEFYQVVDHLIDQGSTFVNPYEYYKLINNIKEFLIF